MHDFVKKCDGHKFYTELRAESSFDQFFMYHFGNLKYCPFPTYWPMGSHTNKVSRKNAKVINFARGRAQSRVSIGFSCTILEIQNTSHSQRITHGKFEFRSVFRASSQKFNILAILDVLAHGKPYEHGFEKKRDDHKLYTKSRADSSFDRFFVQSQKFKILAMPDILAHVMFQSVFHVPFWKFKILAIPDVLAHGKSYEHGFAKKCDGHKLCAKSRQESSFNWFFMHHLGNSK
ncbi:hypothetical protein GW17_00058378 [Ensete ventricosum]|nr:hypothetical protein GW17_00058378 [Ensete ventricosum]